MRLGRRFIRYQLSDVEAIEAAGTAGGGKGAFVRVVTGVIGQKNLTALRTGLLAERFELSRFIGRTLLYGADVPDDFLNQRSASVMKALTGGDPVTPEFKNSNEVPDMTCRFNILITSNSRLRVRLEGDTDAWRRRLAVVRYTQPKTAHPITDLSERILREEGPGVLNWMLDGLDRARAANWQLILNERQQRIVDDLLLESDGHREFVRNCMTKDGTSTVLINDAYTAYVDFCDDRGWAAVSRNQFGKAVPDIVVQEYRIPVRRDIKDTANKAQQGWKGLKLKREAELTSETTSEASGTGASLVPPEASEGFTPPDPTTATAPRRLLHSL